MAPDPNVAGVRGRPNAPRTWSHVGFDVAYAAGKILDIYERALEELGSA